MSHTIPANVGFVLDEDAGAEAVLHLMVLPDGRPGTLRGTAATMWALALETDDVVGELAAMVGRPRDDIAAETDAFVSDLVLQGFLQPDSPPALPSSTSRDGT